MSRYPSALTSPRDMRRLIFCASLLFANATLAVAQAGDPAVARTDDALRVFEQSCLRDPFDMSRVAPWAEANGFQSVPKAERPAGAMTAFRRATPTSTLTVWLGQQRQCHVEVEQASADRAIEGMQRLVQRWPPQTAGVSVHTDRRLPGGPAGSRQVAYMIKLSGTAPLGLMWGVIAVPTGNGTAEVKFSTGAVRADR